MSVVAVEVRSGEERSRAFIVRISTSVRLLLMGARAGAA
jgi:hypothetical protein